MQFSNYQFNWTPQVTKKQINK